MNITISSPPTSEHTTVSLDNKTNMAGHSTRSSSCNRAEMDPAEFGSKLFVGEVANQVFDFRPTPAYAHSCTASKSNCHLKQVHDSAAWCHRFHPIAKDIECLTHALHIMQYLSKYGESAELLKDPSWTKDLIKADKGTKMAHPPARSVPGSQLTYYQTRAHAVAM